MPAFQAINVEPEEDIDEEVDNTRELQVDDALKRFQTALKLHAQGPRFFDEAADAYDDLFRSDIFSYPEASTEYERSERPPTQLTSGAPFAPPHELAATDGDGAGSSLPQALYLSYKNHGQFLLDRIRHDARTADVPRPDFFARGDVLDRAREALTDLNAAVDRDPSDAELWRRTARVASFLKSARTARYCLEAAIELDDDPAVDQVDPPSLAEGLAGEQLKEQLRVLGDEVALSHPIMAPWVRKSMPALIRRQLDPLPYLPDSSKRLAVPRPKSDETRPARLVMPVPVAAWPDLGIAIITMLNAQGSSGEAIIIELPGCTDDDDVVMSPTELAGNDSTHDEQLQLERQLALEVAQAESLDKEATLKEKKSDERVPSPELTRKERSISIPNRKRSHSAAGLNEAPEDENGVEKRSKRIRRRETQQEEAIDPSTLHATQLQQYQAADQYLFQMTKNILENLGATDPAAVSRLNEVLDLCAADDRSRKIEHTASADLRHALTAFSEDDAKILLNKKEQPTLGLSSFLEHTKTSSQKAARSQHFDESSGIKAFARKINRGWSTIQSLAFEWLRAVHPSYQSSKWSDAMKLAVVQVLRRFDSDIYQMIREEVLDKLAGERWGPDMSELDGMVQMVFELHLDVYERINNPSSAVDQTVRVEMRDRLNRWLDFASEMSRLRSSAEESPLTIRFLWGATLWTTLVDGASRDHILQCWAGLREHLGGSDGPQIDLPNNAVMAEVSSGAADREISKLTTMDFFLGLFQDDLSDPIAVIENLEPVLNPESVAVPATPSPLDEAGHRGQKKLPLTGHASQGLQDLWKFLSGSSTELRLFLWLRLGEAYGKIKYPTKQFSCHLKSIETIVADFDGSTYTKHAQEARIPLLSRMLRALDEQLIQALSLALNESSAFDIVDDEHIRSTTASLARLSCLLHVSLMYEDEVRIGMTQPSQTGATMQAFLNRLREIQVRAWSLQYTVLRVGIANNPSTFPSPETDLASFLSATHQVLGLRKFCKASNKIFLKMMRVELMKMKGLENWEDYVGQVLYDLHGLKLGVGLEEVQDHGCPPEKLEKKSAVQLVEPVTALARGIPMKDLLKSDLKNTIEAMQQAIGQTKSTPQMMYNFKNFTEYLRRSIHPLRLYQALTGGVTLDAVAVNTPEGTLANHGWFFLLGMIALTKFKGVDLNRRQTPGATDDLRIGATFIRLQLQFTPDKWEAWFRLAECFDYEIDEAVLWTADKMNKDRPELVKLQRSAIHCYTLALSHSYTAEIDPEDIDSLHDLYHNFAMRLYASSREPFAMEPFLHEDQERFFIESQGAGTYRKILHGQMQDFKVWKYSAGLFRKAMERRPKDWKNPYMYSKCLWKMYQTPDEQLDEKDKIARPRLDSLIKALEKAIQVVVAVPKSRNSDPILEPHYKMVSIVHKLVMRHDLSPPQAVEILSRQPFGVTPNEDEPVEDLDDWEGYIIRNIRLLKDKDKSNWQHRIIIRHARVLFDDESTGTNAVVQAMAAIGVLRESMFTKTMVMNVWKCEAERAGRHHVYTGQYIRFMVKLLLVTSDRTNLEALLRRLRKKGADFYHFNELWQSCCSSYLRLLRATFGVRLTIDDAFKSVSLEEFEILSERLTDWAATPAANVAVFNCMKEAIELKKLNGGQMRVAAIDDLIHDSYASIYFDIAKDLDGPDVARILEDRIAAREKSVAPADYGELRPQNNAANLLNPPSGAATPQSTADLGDKAGPTAAEAAPRRKTGVKRAEVIKKAEQAVLRAAEAPRMASGGASGSTSKSRLGSISSGKRGSHTPNGEKGQGSDSGDDDVEGDGEGDVDMKDDGAAEGEGDGEGEGEGDGEAEGEAEAEAEAEADGEGEGERDGDEEDEDEEHNGSHAREAEDGSALSGGSVHDSADDESELSDPPEGYDEDLPMALLSPNLAPSIGASTAAADTEDDGDDEGDEDEDEDDEEGAEESGDEGGSEEEDPEAVEE